MRLVLVSLLSSLLSLAATPTEGLPESDRLEPLGKHTTNAPAVSFSSIIGEVRDARNLSPAVIYPDGLPVVPGARVEVTTLRVSTTADAQGRFRFDNVTVTVADQARPYLKVDIQVSAPGFGLWQIAGAPVRPEGNYLRLTVDLRAVPVTRTYTPPEEASPKRTSTSWTTPVVASTTVSAGGHLARPLETGCNGFIDQVFPPGSIRVYRVAAGEVVTVNFINYVKNVLPNEWVAGSDPMEALKAAAVAVKMYGWQRLNDIGNNFGGIFNGQCWDVDDTQTYQVYQPNVAHQRTDFATAATWSVIVKRAGTVLEALYRNDGITACARYDGSVMQQLAMTTCANQGLGWDSILRTFYDNIDIDWMGGGPAVAATPTLLRLDVFVRGADGNIYQKFWENGLWSGWSSALGLMPIRAASDPSAAWTKVGLDEKGRLDVAVTGKDNNLYVNTWTALNGWSGWTSLGGIVTSGPAVVSKRVTTGVDILWRDQNHNLKRDTLVGSQFQYVTPDPPVLPVTPDASAIWDPSGSWWQNSGNLELFTASNDPGQQIYQTTYVSSSNSWTVWNAQGTGVLPPPPAGGVQSKPAVAAKNEATATRIDVLIRGANETMQWRYWNGSWSAWQSMGTPTPNHVESGPGAIWWQNNSHLELFVRGEDGNLYQNTSTDGLSWLGWAGLGAYP